METHFPRVLDLAHDLFMYRETVVICLPNGSEATFYFIFHSVADGDSDMGVAGCHPVVCGLPLLLFSTSRKLLQLSSGAPLPTCMIISYRVLMMLGEWRPMN